MGELDIRLCGVNFDKLPPDVRGVFILDAATCRDVSVKVRRRMNAQGCVVLSTCNRTEVWVQGGQGTDPFPWLCNALALRKDLYQQWAYSLSGDCVVAYAMSLACGIHSSLFGEDQIISQITASLDNCRMVGVPGPVLERLFRLAVTTAKAVHTHVRLAEADETVARHVVELVRNEQPAISTLLIIGTGQMARLVALQALACGVAVTMTIRDIEKAQALVPTGCTAVSYDQRFALLPSFDAVVCATAGLAYALDAEHAAVQIVHPTLLVDLAMPADVDPLLAGHPLVALVRASDIQCDRPRRDGAVLQAQGYIHEAVQEFYSWHEKRGDIGDIMAMAGAGSQDTLWRLQRTIGSLGLEPTQVAMLNAAIEDSARKSFAHQLFARYQEHTPQ